MDSLIIHIYNNKNNTYFMPDRWLPLPTHKFVYICTSKHSLIYMYIIVSNKTTLLIDLGNLFLTYFVKFCKLCVWNLSLIIWFVLLFIRLGILCLIHILANSWFSEMLIWSKDQSTILSWLLRAICKTKEHHIEQLSNVISLTNKLKTHPNIDCQRPMKRGLADFFYSFLSFFDVNLLFSFFFSFSLFWGEGGSQVCLDL